MGAGAVNDAGSIAVARAKQVFRFLKAFAEKNVPVRRQISEHHWAQWLRELPDHPAIVVGEVQVGGSSEDAVPPDGAVDQALITIRRPTTTQAPEPPDDILDFLQAGWRDPEKSIEILDAHNVVRNGQTVSERFDADVRRVQSLAAWRAKWHVWATAERPARDAMRIFERFYELRGRIDRESERVELMLGDGRLRWTNTSGTVDHPVLLQRVELVFDADVLEFRIVDTDREPELYTAVLQGGETLSPQQLNNIRSELETGGYHPLAKDGTSGFLRRVVHVLAPNGEFDATGTDRAISARPMISRDPVLFLRDRSSGFPAAFDRVLQDLEQRAEVPVSLTRLVGVELPVSDQPDVGEWSPWGEPPEILLSKPANEEQVQIARALDRHKAVIVQGPPGTGKSHTIANLIGHLVANGKRVLITSHTTKALRVLRGQIVETLRPLCVALLENDLEGRTQMEEAVKGILWRLTTSTPASLEREVAQLSEARADLNREVGRITRDLRTVREAEYAPIIVDGESVLPSEAAQYTKVHQQGNEWIPGPVNQGAPLPLSTEELAELYLTNAQVSLDEEEEIAQGVAPIESIPEPAVFGALVTALDATESPDLSALWERHAREEELPLLHRLRELIVATVEHLGRVEKWQRAMIAAGHTGGSDAELWNELATMVYAADDRLQRAKPHLVRHAPHLPQGMQSSDAVQLSQQIETHLRQGGSLGAFGLLLNPRWKTFIREARCNGRAPAGIADMQALRALAELIETRVKLGMRWERQATVVGLPDFKSFGADPEPKLKDYASQFRELLGWWNTHWLVISSAATKAGLRWETLRNREVARAGPAAPFDRDAAILGGALLHAVGVRVAMAERSVALRLLNDLETAVGRFKGRRSRAVYDAVRGRNEAAYALARGELHVLLAKVDISHRRQALLERLKPAAAEWTAAIRTRAKMHGEKQLPGDAKKAWRWRQLNQEVERRAALDEVELTQKLHRCRTELRDVTASVIDRRAWLGQIRRIDLPARQALQGWAQTQKRIGKGTGKRVPALQAEARKLLVQARDAVPVWIMPLARVAESFDATKGKFDVVIVDEASQSDVTGLLAWYLGDRVAIVGDHEQVSPLGVGQKLAEITELIAQHLIGVPNSHLYDGQLSIYDLARQSFGGTIALREHFRCVPDIIDFSNYLSYNGDIRPLRDPTRVPRPHVLEYVVAPDGAAGGDKRNVKEAQTVVAILKALSELPENKGRTMGAIALVGDEQASLIQDLALQALGAVELERHRFAAGNAAQFQGDERDIMLLSMVDVPIGRVLPIRQTDIFKQRYNVAVSRARDQLWLVHSLDPNRDLQAGDLRRRLIEHVRSPAARRGAIQNAQARAESPFESSMLQLLIAAGYRVAPQVWVGQHRIDIVVSDDNGQVAVECDGDRFHGVDEIPADMARQAVLERAGWRFIRVRGTRYYRDREGTMRWVYAELARLGVHPAAGALDAAAIGTGQNDFRDNVVRRAWEIMREQGWVAPLDIEPVKTVQLDVLNGS
jgi:very-short-patch-repair endonuclease